MTIKHRLTALTFLPLLCAAFLMAQACLGDCAFAALKPKDSIKIEETWNPHGDILDFILPMPCGIGLAMRVAAVPAKGFLWDLSTTLGCDDCAEDGRAFYDSRYQTALSGAFAAEDFPPKWRDRLPSGEYRFYMIGKYEITGLQWKAVMGDSCPLTNEITPEDARPKTDISWYEAVEFTRRLTGWLLDNAKDSLPSFPGDSKNVGFIRLPTEAEWEYAARGGQLASSQWLQQENFFKLQADTTIRDYAVYRPEGAGRIEESALRIGSRRPNPIGLYDTAGNAAEMVMDPFRFSLGGRLHGSAGGFVRKGGSYLSGEAEIMPGRREETAFFQIDGPTRARDLGFRVVLSGINTPSGTRQEALRKEWQKAGEDYSPLISQSRNTLEELDRMLALAKTDSERENFKRLRAIIKENNIALERQKAIAAASLVRGSVYMIEAVRNYAIRRHGAEDVLKKMESEKKANAGKNLGIDFDGPISRTKEIVQALAKGQESALAFYRGKIDDSLAFSKAELSAAFEDVRKDFKKDDRFSETLRGALDLYEKHIEQLRKGQKQGVERHKLIEDIIAAKYR